MIITILGFTAGAVALAAHGFYAYSIIRGRTRPSRTTWLIWSTLTLLIAASYSGSGATDTLWAAVGEAIGTLFIFVLALKYGVGGWDPLDRFVIVGTIIGVAIWYLSGSAVLAVFAFLFADFMGGVPTIVKTFKDPWEEEWFPWAVTVFANVLTIFALDLTTIPEWELGVAVFPFYFTAINGLILLLILRPKLGLYNQPLKEKGPQP